MKKENIQAIYPLSQSQLSFLIHHITADKDQGLLQLSFDIEGDLNLVKLNEALNQVIKRHEALRATVHWEKIKKPVIVIHKDHQQAFEIIQSEGAQSESINKIRQDQKQNGIDFNQKGLSRFVLYQFSPTTFTCVWTCHHILLDGWSSVNLVNELFKRYQNVTKNNDAQFPKLPSIGNINDALNQVNEEKGIAYWNEFLKSYSKPKSIGKTNQQQDFKRVSLTISVEELVGIKATAKQLKTSLASLLQLAWSISLCKFYNTTDVVYGVVSSGRNLPVKGIEDVAYLLTNTLPYRFEQNGAGLAEFIQALDVQKVKNFERETDHLADIEKWIDWQENSPLIESVFAFANFQWKSIITEDFDVKNLVGDYTSTFPLTLLLFEDNNLSATLDFDANIITPVGAQALLSFFKKTVLTLINRDVNISELLQQGQEFEMATTFKAEEKQIEKRNYNPPTNPTELLLNKIWQEVLGINGLSIDDDFFKLGGKSVQALRICVAIEKETGTYFNPTYLLLNPTIKKLALIIEETNLTGQKSKSTCLVPLKTTGTNPPLFCLHAAEGNILFYKDLAENMPKENPIYAVQPQPLENGLLPDSIQSMAKQYFDEIKKISKSKPLFLLGSCYSNPICLEIAELALAENRTLGAIYIVDSGPPLFSNKRAEIEDLPGLFTRIKRVLKERDFSALKRITKRILPGLFRRKFDHNSPVNIIKQQLKNTLIGYDYKTHRFGIQLVRSSVYAATKKFDYHIDNWKEIVDSVEVSVVEDSTHNQIFEMPEVKRLAKVLAQKINQN